MDYEQYKNNTPNTNFLCKTLLVLLLLSSCAIKKQYYAYESEQKDKEGRPLQYYTLEHQSGREFETDIIRFSDLMTYNNIFVLIETGEDYTFFAWSVDTSSTRKPYYQTFAFDIPKQTIFKKLYRIDAKKAIFRYKNNLSILHITLLFIRYCQWYSDVRPLSYYILIMAYASCNFGCDSP